jgi:uncharacterized protein YjbJ (UPF0337 family)
MSGKMQEIQGRVKEAAGAIADDETLRREGKMDQATGQVKQTAEKVIDKVTDAAKRVNRSEP